MEFENIFEQIPEKMLSNKNRRHDANNVEVAKEEKSTGASYFSTFTYFRNKTDYKTQNLLLDFTIISKT